MRITRTFVVATLVALAGFSAANAQEGAGTGMKGKIAVSPVVGAVMPIQYLKASFADGGGGGKLGFAAGAAGEYFVTDDMSVGAKIVLDRFGMDTEDFGDNVSGNWTVFEFGVFARRLFMPGMMTRPYARAGLLMGKAKAKTESGSNEAEVDIAIAPGAELAFGAVHEVAPNISIFGELNWTAIATDGKDADEVFNGTTTDTEEFPKHLQWIGLKVGALFFIGN